MSDLELKTVGALRVKSKAEGIVEAIVATLGVVDRDGDVVKRGAIADGAKVKMSAYGHDAIYGAPPAGKGTLHIENDRAVFRGRVFLSTQRGRETFELLKALGSDSEWSFGFRVVGTEHPDQGWRAKGAQRMLTKLDAFEVSPVLRGAGIGTGTVAVKQSAASAAALAVAAARKTSARNRELLERLRPRYEQRAYEVAAVATKTLSGGRMAAPRIVFFEPHEHPDCKGYFRQLAPDEIGVSRGLSPRELVRTVIHESAHRCDWGAGSLMKLDTPQVEASARHAERLLLHHFDTETL